jgi:cytochrome c-type biogenesis protein CcmH
MRFLFLVLFSAFVVTAQAAIEAYEFESVQMETDYNRLISELRCLVCQNQNLSGSDADLARDLRRQTYEMLMQGNSTDQVIEFMVARYGDFVLYRPQFKASTYLLWLGPFVLLIGVLFIVIKRARGKAETDVVSPDAMAKAKEILQKNEQIE